MNEKGLHLLLAASVCYPRGLVNMLWVPLWKAAPLLQALLWTEHTLSKIISCWIKTHVKFYFTIFKLTFLSHICKGLLPMLYNIDRNPLWNVFLNILASWSIEWVWKYGEYRDVDLLGGVLVANCLPDLCNSRYTKTLHVCFALVTYHNSPVVA